MEMIPFVDLKFQAREDEPALVEKFKEVLRSGVYILGKEVETFEANFARICGTKHAVGVANGTASIYLILKALGIKAGDEVITAPNSFIATASAVALLGAKPVFVDIANDLNIDASKIEAAITPRTKAILPVHLTGRVANMPAINLIAKKYGLYVIEDAAQAAGATLEGKAAGSWGTAGSFSLHPLKVFHAYGDAGMITTDDAALAAELRKLRNLGFRNRDECAVWSGNDRLDEIHAGMLNTLLASMPERIALRRKIAAFYRQELGAHLTVAQQHAQEEPVYQTFMIQVDERDRLQKYLYDHGIETKVHYPIPIHRQECARDLGHSPEDFPNTMRLVGRILSLPIYPGLTDVQLNYIVDRVKSFYHIK